VGSFIENSGCCGKKKSLSEKKRDKSSRKSFSLYRTNGDIYSAAALCPDDREEDEKDTDPRYMYVHRHLHPFYLDGRRMY
jgi:hypothetical protein